LRPKDEDYERHYEREHEPHEELEFDANDADVPPAAKPPVAGKPAGPSTGPIMPGRMPERKPNAPFMHQNPGVAGKPASPSGKPAPAWNRPKMEPTEINMSDDNYVSPNDLKSSIDPKLNESGEGHVRHAVCRDANVVQAFKSLDKWVKKSL
jgi:hypothetical protein